MDGALSKSTCYALYAMAEMTTARGTPVTVTGVATRYRIPEGALAKVFQQLVRARLAIGTRGIGGGYRLARSASRVGGIRSESLSDVWGRSTLPPSAGAGSPAAPMMDSAGFHVPARSSATGSSCA